MEKKGYMLVGLADKRTGNMVAFNLESAVFEIGQEGTSNLLVEDVVYTVDTIELMTLLQGCGVELMHCERQPEAPQVTTQEQVQTPIEGEANAE